jgi:pyridoxamine 5'-phosphate oxidase
MDRIDPIHMFAEVFQQAIDAGIPEPNAMALATSTPDGLPSVRMVLLKGFDESGFVFYTNLESRKGHELRANPHAALCFHWKELGKQVRIEGPTTPVSDAEADEYFASRTRGSQLGSWSSKQSAPLTSRDELLERVRETEERFKGMTVTRPPYWSGFRVSPTRIEFWTSGEFRLHDRLVFERVEGGGWGGRRVFP